MSRSKYNHFTEHKHIENIHREHEHAHGSVDPSLATSRKGLWAVKWSSVVLLVGACLQLAVVLLSGSVSLLGDAIHNFGDAATALPLSAAFLIGRRKANNRFNYGYGKVEDVAGVIVILVMLTSALFVLYFSTRRIFYPQAISHLWVVGVASLIGFVINEGAAIFRIRVGKQIKSQALVTDGYHARTDGWSSLAVLFGAIGVSLGFRLADPLVGILLSIVILKTTWSSAKEVGTRALDGVDPEVVDLILHAVNHTKGIAAVSNTRLRWIGHKLHAELNVAVDPMLSIAQAHDISKEAEENLREHLPWLSHVLIHVDPLNSSGEKYHAAYNLKHHHEHIHQHS